MPFLDHLEELRWRIVKSVAALAVAFGVAFTVVWDYFDPIIKYLISPVKALLPDGVMYFTHVFDKFTILMQISGVAAIVFASPVVGYQLWAFLVPALTPRERRVITPVLTFAAVLFIAGVALALKVFLPITADLMTGLKTDAMAPLLTTNEYFGFLFMLCLAFGALFELPILVLVLTALGLITPAFLSKYRRHAIVATLVICEIITPGDLIISTLILWVPVYGLYELSIVVSWFVARAKRKNQAESESIAGAAA
jgi:sec-independent protein translocase protein TatC